MKKSGEWIAIYSRKSKFTGKGESIGNQVELGKEYVRVHFGKDEMKNIRVYEDEGFSGGNLNRPDFKKMMNDANERKLKAIIVYRLDRISRNVSDFSGLIEELTRLDIAFISIKEQFDTSTPMGRAMMYISSVFSQLERETTAERIRDNMHELAKTGRWLGGTTPTGYASESVKTITVDGKSKKACKLKVIPEEAETIKTIIQLFTENNSLTVTEAELMRRRMTTKTGGHFSRFTLKSILQNPVYMIADHDAYEYFKEKDADLFSDLSDFDGIHGIMAYNRTDQKKGRSTVYRPVSDWIVSVGKHPGLVSGKTWIGIQETLEQNKSKSFRRPKKNTALLTGLLFCSCGSRMYPKLSQRKTADGEIIYTYVCKMKEHSQRSICNGKNANGNTLDMAVVEEIKKLDDDKSEFCRQLEQSRKFYTWNHTEYEEQLASMKIEKTEMEKKIDALVDSLAEMGDSGVRTRVAKRIEEYNSKCELIEDRIQKLESFTSRHALSEIEFDVLRQLLTVFKNGIDEMTVEQKRAAIRTVVRKIVWDGTYAHIYLFGSPDDTIEFPDIPEKYQKEKELYPGYDSGEENDELLPFSDVDYEGDNAEGSGQDGDEYSAESKTHLREDSK